MKDENFRLLVIVVVVFLIVSLLMNGMLAADPGLVKGPPVKIHGYVGSDGRPVDGYYSSGQETVRPAGQPAGTMIISTKNMP